jgi:16S rRNA C967 or C1407 C5-methylase (RsmB/RsmF family)
MADVPCSGEGRLRGKKQDKFLNARSIVRNKLLELQKKIIIRGFDLLKDEGVMLYSTCTYNPEENESAVQYLLDNRDAQVLPLKYDFPFEKGLKQWRGFKYDKEMERTARFYPHHVNSVGFFMARIGKRRR